MDTSAKVRLAETKLAAFAKGQASQGRMLSVDNAVAAYVGTRIDNEPAGPDVEGAVKKFVTEPFNKAVSEYEAAGKKAKAIRISVWEDRIQIVIE